MSWDQITESEPQARSQDFSYEEGPGPMPLPVYITAEPWGRKQSFKFIMCLE
jgi:hypothetical protein